MADAKVVYSKVKEYIMNQLPIKDEDIKLDSRLIEDLGADSANLMMLIMDLEMEYDITVSDDMLANVKTVGDIVKYLEENT
jgi:acyl carrier protein